jgi:hypothetical protein
MALENINLVTRDLIFALPVRDNVFELRRGTMSFNTAARYGVYLTGAGLGVGSGGEMTQRRVKETGISKG